MQEQGTIRPGMRVLGSDGAEIGTIDQVLVSPDGQSARLVLADGDTRIPTDLVTYVGGNEVQIKMSAATARGTSWGDVPLDFDPTGSFPFAAAALGETETVRVQRYEEVLVPEKTMVETGAVQIRKSVVEEPQTITMPVLHEEYVVERVPVNRPWQPGDDTPRTEGATMIIPIVTEKLEVMRRKVVMEELRLTKRVVTEQRQVTGTVRKEVVEVTGPVQETPRQS